MTREQHEANIRNAVEGLVYRIARDMGRFMSAVHIVVRVPKTAEEKHEQVTDVHTIQLTPDFKTIGACVRAKYHSLNPELVLLAVESKIAKSNTKLHDQEAEEFTRVIKSGDSDAIKKMLQERTPSGTKFQDSYTFLGFHPDIGWMALYQMFTREKDGTVTLTGDLESVEADHTAIGDQLIEMLDPLKPLSVEDKKLIRRSGGNVAANGNGVIAESLTMANLFPRQIGVLLDEEDPGSDEEEE